MRIEEPVVFTIRKSTHIIYFNDRQIENGLTADDELKADVKKIDTVFFPGLKPRFLTKLWEYATLPLRVCMVLYTVKGKQSMDGVFVLHYIYTSAQQ